jgi:hypothetical protein
MKVTDVETLLARLRDAPLDSRLDGLDARVMAEIAGIPTAPSLGATAFGLASVMALVVGIAGAAVPASPADATPISPFDANQALAPSTLLGAQ